jgi:hypothetical protein
MPYNDLLWSALFTLLVILGALLAGAILAEMAARYRVGAARRRSEAERRACALLMEWLSSAQLAQYQRTRGFEVRGSHSRKRYRIRSGRQMNIDELDDHGRRIAVWCFLPEKYVPVADVMLAQKIALENDEPAAMAVAIRNSSTFSRQRTAATGGGAGR